MQLERDTLLREKQQLLAELNNRNEVIHHLQDHVVSTYISINILTHVIVVKFSHVTVFEPTASSYSNWPEYLFWNIFFYLIGGFE